jgi:hypothetical protein
LRIILWKEKDGDQTKEIVRAEEILASEHLLPRHHFFSVPHWCGTRRICTTVRRYHMDSVIQFLESVTGKTLRAILGLVLLALGIFVIQGVWGIVVDIIGVIVLVAGLFGILLLAPLFGYTVTGQKREGHVGS